MKRGTRHLTFEELAERLGPQLDDLERGQEAAIVDKNGKFFRIEPLTGGEKPHDAERVRRMLVRTAGALQGVDIVQLKKDLRAARRQTGRSRSA